MNCVTMNWADIVLIGVAGAMCWTLIASIVLLLVGAIQRAQAEAGNAP